VPLTLSSIDTGPFGFALPPDSSPEGRLRNRALIEQGMQALAPAQAYFASVLRRLGAVREPPFILDAMTLLTDRYLQLTIPSLEYRAVTPRRGSGSSVPWLRVHRNRLCGPSGGPTCCGPSAWSW